VSADESLGELASRIEGLAEQLADRSLDLLRQAVAGPEHEALAKTEKVVTRARRSMEKAAALLRGIAD
jgi:hypothetical protein